VWCARQGGFIVMQPSEEVYRQLVHIVMNTEFAQGGGWNRYGHGAFYCMDAVHRHHLISSLRCGLALRFVF
jgi:hypothetical protein